jgi:mono/diheme cytochrome c family protein
MRGCRRWVLLVTFALFGGAIRVAAQSPGAANLRSGKEIYEAGCAGCHGGDGKGAPQSTIGFEKPSTFPDFTQCSQTTPEDNRTWHSIIRNGGPSRGFSQIMPSFSEALTREQVRAVIQYLRGFCKEPGWPRGELNLPLALVTEKAFPENETLITGSVNVSGPPGNTSHIIHEQRFGERNQIEIDLPIEFVRPEPGLWYGGFGDLTLGLKRVLAAKLNNPNGPVGSQTGSILSVFGGVLLPTGNSAHGLGSGTTTFETFLAFGQLLPRYFFIQAQGGAELPTDTSKAPQNVFFRTVLGKGLAQNQGLGRLWAPMVEWVGSRDLVRGAATSWDAVPQMQVTLSRRQHVRFNLGLGIPATNRAGRNYQLLFYILWDWQDGRLLDGW